MGDALEGSFVVCRRYHIIIVFIIITRRSPCTREQQPRASYRETFYCLLAKMVCNHDFDRSNKALLPNCIKDSRGDLFADKGDSGRPKPCSINSRPECCLLSPEPSPLTFEAPSIAFVTIGRAIWVSSNIGSCLLCGTPWDAESSSSFV